jgi:DNA gyrase/topoisomerase IV subunit A
MQVKKLDAPKDMQIGSRFETKKHGFVTVVDYYNTHTVIVAFENTGNVRSITAAKLRSGQLTDRSVPAQSSLVGKRYKSVKHGVLTVTQVESDNIVVLKSENGDEIRILIPAMGKLKEYVENSSNQEKELELPTSLSALTKRNRKTKDVNNLLKKIITDYGK